MRIVAKFRITTRQPSRYRQADMPLTDPKDLQRVLQDARTIAVVGYSDNPSRASNDIARMLKRVGYDVYLVNPTLDSTPEQTIYARVADIPTKIDIVDIFRRPE